MPLPRIFGVIYYDRAAPGPRHELWCETYAEAAAERVRLLTEPAAAEHTLPVLTIRPVVPVDPHE